MSASATGVRWAARSCRALADRLRLAPPWRSLSKAVERPLPRLRPLPARPRSCALATSAAATPRRGSLSLLQLQLGSSSWRLPTRSRKIAPPSYSTIDLSAVPLSPTILAIVIEHSFMSNHYSNGSFLRLSSIGYPP